MIQCYAVLRAVGSTVHTLGGSQSCQIYGAYTRLCKVNLSTKAVAGKGMFYEFIKPGMTPLMVRLWSSVDLY